MQGRRAGLTADTAREANGGARAAWSLVGCMEIAWAAAACLGAYRWLIRQCGTLRGNDHLAARDSGNRRRSTKRAARQARNTIRRNAYGRGLNWAARVCIGGVAAGETALCSYGDGPNSLENGVDAPKDKSRMSCPRLQMPCGRDTEALRARRKVGEDRSTSGQTRAGQYGDGGRRPRWHSQLKGWHSALVYTWLATDHVAWGSDRKAVSAARHVAGTRRKWVRSPTRDGKPPDCALVRDYAGCSLIDNRGGLGLRSW